MPAYRLYLLDVGGRVIESRDVTCKDDASAEILARGIVADTPQVHAVEAWLRPRLVCRVGNEAHGALAVDTIVRARPRRR